jgi:hypothetical protein
MVEVWQFWEFEHYSNNIVRVIDAPNGLELFAVDVFQIIAPALNDEKVALIDTKVNQRFVILDHEVVEISTLNALAIHSLIGIVTSDMVKQFMQWVRSNIIPVFKRDLIIEPRTQDPFVPINFYRKDSLVHYLYLKGQRIWQIEIETIEFYLQLLYKKIPLSASCPQADNHQALSLRFQYLELGKPMLYDIDNYEELYNGLVLSPPDLLIAQELDFYIYNSLKKIHSHDLARIMKQGIILQALKSSASNLANFGKVRYLEILYFQILECFSNNFQ